MCSIGLFCGLKVWYWCSKVLALQATSKIYPLKSDLEELRPIIGLGKNLVERLKKQFWDEHGLQVVTWWSHASGRWEFLCNVICFLGLRITGPVARIYLLAWRCRWLSVCNCSAVPSAGRSVSRGRAHHLCTEHGWLLMSSKFFILQNLQNFTSREISSAQNSLVTDLLNLSMCTWP